LNLCSNPVPFDSQRTPSQYTKHQITPHTASACCCGLQLIPQAATSFKRYMQRAITPGFLAALLVAGAQPGSSSNASSELQPAYNADVGALLLPAFLQYCQEHYQ